MSDEVEHNAGWATGQTERSASRDGLAAMAILILTVALIVFVVSSLV